MAKIKNQRIYSNDIEFLERLAAEQRDYIGRKFTLDKERGVLIIYAVPPKKQRKPKEKKERDKRSEKFERRG